MTSFKFRLTLPDCFGVLLVVLFIVHSGNSEVWREPIQSQYGYGTRYSSNQDANFYRRSSDSEEEIEMDHRRRSATDAHGRSVLFKSLVLAPLALVVFFLIVLLYIPIPVISNPGRRRSLQTSSYQTTIQKARDVLLSEECVERVSCELSRISKKYDMAWIPNTVGRIMTKNKWGDRILKGIQLITAPESKNANCTNFSCNAAKNIKRSLKFK